MDNDELSFQLYRVEMLKLAGQVQVLCGMASLAADPSGAFETLHRVLDTCKLEASNYEARLIKDQEEEEDVWPSVEKESPDGN